MNRVPCDAGGCSNNNNDNDNNDNDAETGGRIVKFWQTMSSFSDKHYSSFVVC